ncbi:MAG: flagellar export chaperone FliS [Alkaliphilus sp.]|nr:flagellar export chaperone FliS [bacterium AH-315-L21]MBN4062846.1 flagellar export chaperone FliS [Alkaliphilus sp. AH-315-G20]PHS30027.1 MAG: flagellar export chaperone FliS [Alkaliphilus sp.]
MQALNPYAKYKENNIKTASPQELTLMLYNGALKFVGQSKIFMEQKRIEDANNSIIRVQDIIDELNATLDMQYEISHNLRSLYLYIGERLVDANISKSSESLEEVKNMITELRDTWKEAMEIVKPRKKVAR